MEALKLLGHGLDALFARSRMGTAPPMPPSPEQRLARYNDAVMLLGSPDIETREARGGEILLNLRKFGSTKRPERTGRLLQLRKAR